MMGDGCIKTSKYFLFLFNLIFFLLGLVVLGFGLWLLLDNQSFIVVINKSPSSEMACYIFIGVGGFSMLLGFIGCVGTACEVRCLLGLYFTCLLLIFIAQIAAGALIWFQKEAVHKQMSKIISEVVTDYSGNNTAAEKAWDFLQKKMKCCGWKDHQDWFVNAIVINSSQLLFPCSCENVTITAGNFSDSGFCESATPDWPVYDKGCSASVDSWLLSNIWSVLGVCVGLAVTQLLAMILSIFMCKAAAHQDEYSKVPKY